MAMYILLGARHLEFEIYGFLQPVFKDAETDILCYQIITDGCIERFEPCHPQLPVDEDNFFYCKEELVFNINDYAAYFFLAKDGTSFAGKLNDIAAKISAKLHNSDYNLLEKIEMAEELKCWGFINNIYWHTTGELLAEFGSEETDVLLESELQINIDKNLYEPVSSALEFVHRLKSLSAHYQLKISDILVYNDRYAIAGGFYCSLTKEVIELIDDVEILIKNLRYLNNTLRHEIINEKSALFEKIKNKIDKNHNGLNVLRSLQTILLPLFNSFMPVEKQKNEMVIFKSFKNPKQMSILPDERTEINQMADLVIQRRKKADLV